jgi:hypothetical protein
MTTHLFVWRMWATTIWPLRPGETEPFEVAVDPLLGALDKTTLLYYQPQFSDISSPAKGPYLVGVLKSQDEGAACSHC